MPTYDYVCDACGHEFEHFQSMSDRHLRTCPKCHKKKLVRKVGAGAGLIFKGTGFYITDYRSDKYKDAAKKDSAAAKPAVSEAKPAGGDTKAAAKPEPKPAKPAAAK